MILDMGVEHVVTIEDREREREERYILRTRRNGERSTERERRYGG